ncbi:MAG: L,D-transpeptidase family protein [Planctomycetota bacterium]
MIAALLVLPAVLLGIKILLPGEKTPPPEPAGVVTAIPEPAVASAPDITAEAEPQQAKPRAAVPEAPAAAASPPQSNQPPLARLAAASRQRAREQMGSGLSLAETNHPVDARRALTAALVSGALDPADAAFVRDRLGALNRRLVFSPEVVADDPFSRRYVVGPGDQLGGIVRRESLAIDWRFIMRVNRMVSERSLRAGQRLKLVTGPFHAVVDKSDYRLDLYLGSGSGRVYVASFPVGLGEFDQTPVGRFRVRPHSKLINPQWTHPHTGQRYGSDDPANPIGERWIGLVGADEATRDMVGYGIHGTIEPESIGRSESMGCIRLLPDDVALLYEVLTEQASTVVIRP